MCSRQVNGKQADALDRSFSLTPPDWEPQAANPAISIGVVTFTNAPEPATDNFWRIRSVP